MPARPTPPSPPHSLSCKHCSTGSPSPTTRTGRTDHCPRRATPATIYAARPKATPSADRGTDTHDRVRTDRVDQAGSVTLRVNGRLHHIGVGRTHALTHVLLLVQDLHVRIVDAATGEPLLRELTIDATRDYQPTERPPGPARK